MAIEITEEVVLTRVKAKAYFSEEEFPAVPKLLAKLVVAGKLTGTEALEFAVKQAELLKKDEVFLVVLAALKYTGVRFNPTTYEGKRSCEILGKIAPRMMNVLLGGGPENSTFANYKKVCGLE